MNRPNVLILSGHDPSGGAGVQADIEAVAALGAHGASAITALTRQDTRNVYGVRPVEDAFFRACIDTLTADMTFAAIKVGVLGSPGQAEAIAALADALPDVPLIVDPVLAASGGGRLADDPVAHAVRTALCPRATLITPNAGEARQLCEGEPDGDRCGTQLAALGCHVLITGGDGGPGDVCNRFYAPDGMQRSDTWPRLPCVYHCSGCTLASSVAARLAKGDALSAALAAAQDFTWRSLEAAFTAGRGQAIPDRWAASTS